MRTKQAISGLLLLVLLAGCEGVGDEINAFMESMTPTTPTEAAVMALDQHNPDQRREGTTLLSTAAWGGGDAYLRMYRDYISLDPDPLVRASAARALGRHGLPEDAPLIAESLDDESPIVRWECAKALQRIHNPEVVPALLDVVRNTDEDPNVRVAACRALGQYPTPGVFQTLVGALNARELALNRAAVSSLETLTGQDHGLDSRAWLDWYDGAVRERAVFADQQEYLFPTYRRSIRWYERLAFWNSHVFEKPAPPAGLRPGSQRRTYDDADAEMTGDDGEG